MKPTKSMLENQIKKYEDSIVDFYTVMPDEDYTKKKQKMKKEKSNLDMMIAELF